MSILKLFYKRDNDPKFDLKGKIIIWFKSNNGCEYFISTFWLFWKEKNSPAPKKWGVTLGVPLSCHVEKVIRKVIRKKTATLMWKILNSYIWQDLWLTGCA